MASSVTPEFSSKRAAFERLERAVRDGQIDPARQALADGAPVNGRNAYGTTPLMLAAQYGHTPLLVLLKQAGARVNLADHDGEAALIYAFLSPPKASDGGDFEPDRAMDTVRTLLAMGADPKVCGQTGDPLAFYAAQRVSARQLLELLALGVPAATADASCDGTLLHVLPSCKPMDASEASALVNACVRDGVDLSAVNADGNTALDVAQTRRNMPLAQALADAAAALRNQAAPKARRGPRGP